MTTPDQWIPFVAAAVVAALILLGAALAGAGRFGEMPPPVSDQFVPEAPDRSVGPDDLRTARFATVFRGYSPAQVDRILARAAEQWAAERAPRYAGPSEPAASVWARAED